MKFRYSLRGLLLGPVAVGAVVALYWWLPKKESLPINDFYIGYYHGLGLSDDAAFFGKQFYLVKFPPTVPEDGYTCVRVNNEGYNDFYGTYPNGSIRETGECYVALELGGAFPAPDIHNVRNGKYFSPNGQLKTEIVNGSGIQTYWNAQGDKIWELEVCNFNRVSAKHYRGSDRLRGIQSQ